MISLFNVYDYFAKVAIFASSCYSNMLFFLKTQKKDN